MATSGAIWLVGDRTEQSRTVLPLRTLTHGFGQLTPYSPHADARACKRECYEEIMVLGGRSGYLGLKQA
jgi:hypothetical protein